MLTGLAAAFFYLFAFAMIASGIMVIIAHNSVHSILFLILAFFNAAALFLLTGAEFLAMILLMVYVGAVAVLFLFIVMMLDVDFLELKRGSLQYAPVGALTATILLVELVVVFVSSRFSLMPSSVNVVQSMPEEVVRRSNIQLIGDVLYTDYVFYFEIAGLILLVAMIGSITLTLRYRTGVKRQSVAEQIARTPETAIEIRKVGSKKGI